MEYWKLTNIFKDNVPVSVITSKTTSLGVLLKPGQFCICYPKTTSTLDAQVRRRMLSLDEHYVNHQNLELGVAYDASVIDKMSEAEQKANDYIKKD